LKIREMPLIVPQLENFLPIMAIMDLCKYIMKRIADISYLVEKLSIKIEWHNATVSTVGSHGLHKLMDRKTLTLACDPVPLDRVCCFWHLWNARAACIFPRSFIFAQSPAITDRHTHIYTMKWHFDTRWLSDYSQ